MKRNSSHQVHEVRTLPDLSIVIRGTLWEVFVVNVMTMHLLCGVDVNHAPLGMTMFGVRRIFLQTGLRPQVAKTTLFHEMMHAASEDVMGTQASDGGKICVELSAELAAHVGSAVLANSASINSFLKKNFKDACFTHERTM
jgi:hypothetical protein